MLLGKLGFLVIECIDWAFIFEPRQVRSYEFMLVRTYVRMSVTNFCRNQFIGFFQKFRTAIEISKQKKSDRS